MSTDAQYRERVADLLTEDEMERWTAWKRASDAVWQQVLTDITRATGLSSADFSVLTRVDEADGGHLRQQRLADDLGWERSRLSRHLDRMEGRGLVRRQGTHAERLIDATPEGHRLARLARLAHAAAVRTHLLRAVPTVAGDTFWSAVHELGAGPA
jgi:DNA-binding MarR family transcriptional regulator